MSAPYHPPIPILNAITQFLDRQDGSESAKSLEPRIPHAVSLVVSHRQTAETISELVTKTQGRVKRMHEHDAAVAKAARDFAEYREQRAHIRQNARRLADFDRINAAIVDAHKTKKAVKKDKYQLAEERLMCAYSNLRARRAAYQKDKKKAAHDAMTAKKVQRAAEVQAKKDQKAADQAAKEATRQAAVDAEERLKMKRRDKQAQVSLELKEVALTLAKKEQEQSESLARLNVAALRWFDNQNEEADRKKGRKRSRIVREIESESEKENAEPSDE